MYVFMMVSIKQRKAIQSSDLLGTLSSDLSGEGWIKGIKYILEIFERTSRLCPV